MGCKVTLLILSIVFLQHLTWSQCYVATYSIETDYSHTEMPEHMKSKLQNVTRKNRTIYKIAASPTWSYEWVDSIAHLCNSESFKEEPKSILRSAGEASIDIVYSLLNSYHRYKVGNPAYHKHFSTIEASEDKNLSSQYFKMIDMESNDFVIFDSERPVLFNLKLIEQVPGMIVEAFIDDKHIHLLAVDSYRCEDLEDKIGFIEELHATEVDDEKDIDIRESMQENPANYISNTDFQCIDRFE